MLYLGVPRAGSWSRVIFESLALQFIYLLTILSDYILLPGRPKLVDGETGVRRKRKKDPNRPKRSTSAYFYFLEYCRKQLNNAGGSITRVSLLRYSLTNRLLYTSYSRLYSSYSRLYSSYSRLYSLYSGISRFPFFLLAHCIISSWRLLL